MMMKGSKDPNNYQIQCSKCDAKWVPYLYVHVCEKTFVPQKAPPAATSLRMACSALGLGGTWVTGTEVTSRPGNAALRIPTCFCGASAHLQWDAHGCI